MNYIYDIYLNLNNVLYDFFDWNKQDKILHIKKIPIFKISEEKLKSISTNIIKIDNTLLKCIINKTELWSFNAPLKYCALFADNNNVIAIEFNKNGKSIKKSSLLINEELDTLELMENMKIKNFEFQILNKTNISLKTRKQIKKEKFISNELKTIDNNRLNYIYFEFFGKKELDKKRKVKALKNITDTKNLYNILKLTSKTANKML